MVPITELWLPILLSAVAVFVLSSLIHMVLGYHKNDFRSVPNEDRVADALRPFNLPPGDYCLPRAQSMKDLKNPAFVEKIKKGPVALITVLPNGNPGMGAQLAQWFLFSVLVSIVAAYIAGRALPAGAEYLDVHRFAGTTAFACYSMAYIPASIWYKKNWGTTLRNMLDGLIYGLFTGGMFGWLWPGV
jgi:hypothetical protein